MIQWSNDQDLHIIVIRILIYIGGWEIDSHKLKNWLPRGVYVARTALGRLPWVLVTAFWLVGFGIVIPRSQMGVGILILQKIPQNKEIFISPHWSTQTLPKFYSNLDTLSRKYPKTLSMVLQFFSAIRIHSWKHMLSFTALAHLGDMLCSRGLIWQTSYWGKPPNPYLWCSKWPHFFSAIRIHSLKKYVELPGGMTHQ